jgi:hypothetical protein
MAHQLILEVPEEIYNSLADAARRSGTMPERLAVAWLTAASRLAAQDPIEPFIGAFRSEVPDWADQHDKYLGQGLVDPTQGSSAGN